MQTTVYRFDFSLAAADADGVSEAQTLSGGGVQAVALDGAFVVGGVAVFDVQRRVIVTSVGDDSGITFTIVGADEAGRPISEVIDGEDAGVASTTLDFLSVSSVTASGDTADDITVGTSSEGATLPKVLNLADSFMPVGIGCTVTGTIDYTIQHTYDDPFKSPEDAEWFVNDDIEDETDNAETAYTTPVTAIRVLINSGSGSVRTRIVQGSPSAY